MWIFRIFFQWGNNFQQSINCCEVENVLRQNYLNMSVLLRFNKIVRNVWGGGGWREAGCSRVPTGKMYVEWQHASDTCQLEEMKNAYCSLFYVLHCFQFHSKREERSPSNGALNACRIVYFISSIQHIRPDSNARARHVNYAWKCVNFPPIGKRTTMKFSSNNCQSVHLIMSRKHTFRNQTTTTLHTKKNVVQFYICSALEPFQTPNNS